MRTYLQSSINKKLSLSLIALCLITVVLFSVFYLLIKTQDYRAQVEEILLEVKEQQIPGIITSLWVVDNLMLDKQVEAIAWEDSIKFAEVTKDGQSLASSGEHWPGTTMVKTYSLDYSYRGSFVYLGELTIEATPDELMNSLFENLVRNALMFMAGILLIAGTFYYLFKKIVGNRLQIITEYTSEISYDEVKGPLVLHDKKSLSHVNDELDDLAVLINKMRIKAAEDIDSLREMQTTLTESAFNLQEANKNLEAFDYSVSNALKVPIRHIEGFSLLLAKSDPDSQKEYINNILQATKEANDLITSLLQLSRSSSAELVRDELNISVMAQSAVSQLAKSIPPESLKVEIELNLTAYGSLDLIKIAVKQLMENAIKFTADNEIRRISFGERFIDGREAFFIEDNGSGIHAKYLDSVFKPFTQCQDTVTEGFGLGLATVERIILRHGGKIWLESTLGSGTTVYFTLPE